METTTSERVSLLRKSNEMMKGLLKRQSIQDVLSEQSDFLFSESGADTIAIFIRQNGSGYARFILEKHNTFSSLIERHNFQVNEDAVAEALWNVLGAKPYKLVDRLCTVLKGIMAERSCRTLADQSAFREAVLFPVSLCDGKQIGLIDFCFTGDTDKADIAKLTELSEMLESVIAPLYDEETGSFYTRYVQVDEAMAMLTTKERDIVKKVLEGEKYSTVATTMGVSINTLKTHMKNIFSKYGVRSKIELQNKIMNG